MSKKLTPVKVHFKKYYNSLNLFGKIYYQLYYYIEGIKIDILLWYYKSKVKKSKRRITSISEWFKENGDLNE